MSKKQIMTKDAYAILKPMKGGLKARGFTIAETMIVIGITGVLFAIIASTLSGRQAKTEFTQAVQEIQSQIQQVISDVTVGYYPNSNNFTCTASLSGPSFSASVTEQGENAGCIFIGKAMQFKANSPSDPEKFNIFSLAGLQRGSDGQEVKTYATPSSTATLAGVIPSSTENKTLKYGLTTLRMTYSGSSATAGTVAFVNSLSGASLGGAGQVRLLPVRGADLNQTTAQAASSIDNYMKGVSGSPDADLDPAGGVTICFVSGGTNQSGRMVIGSNGRRLTVTLIIRNNQTCT
jgi:type II secretory pathway pseudopilin PulG